MRILLSTLLMAVVPFGSVSGDEHFACNMMALTKSERTAHEKLSRTLFAAVQEQDELQDGYAFRLPVSMWVKAAQWVSFERKCCPFFAFELELAKDDGPFWLRVTGSEGIKKFIRAEFGLDS